MIKLLENVFLQVLNFIYWVLVVILVGLGIFLLTEKEYLFGAFSLAIVVGMIRDFFLERR